MGEGESDHDALERELREELGVESRAHRPITTMSHEYPDRIVDLVLWHASIASGEPPGSTASNSSGWTVGLSAMNASCPPIYRSSLYCRGYHRATTGA